jgi:hypothetical protein
LQLVQILKFCSTVTKVHIKKYQQAGGDPPIPPVSATGRHIEFLWVGSLYSLDCASKPKASLIRWKGRP